MTAQRIVFVISMLLLPLAAQGTVVKQVDSKSKQSISKDVLVPLETATIHFTGLGELQLSSPELLFAVEWPSVPLYWTLFNSDKNANARASENPGFFWNQLIREFEFIGPTNKRGVVKSSFITQGNILEGDRSGIEFQQALSQLKKAGSNVTMSFTVLWDVVNRMTWNVTKGENSVKPNFFTCEAQPDTLDNVTAVFNGATGEGSETLAPFQGAQLKLDIRAKDQQVHGGYFIDNLHVISTKFNFKKEANKCTETCMQVTGRSLSTCTR